MTLMKKAAGLIPGPLRLLAPIKLLSALVLLSSVLAETPAHAAVIKSGSILTGATGLNVGGTLYDVEFVDGSCVTVFSGCPSSGAGFAFHTASDALAASEALGSLVFASPNTTEDSTPSLTQGCAGANYYCLIITPFGYTGTFLQQDVFKNYNIEAYDFRFYATDDPGKDYAIETGQNDYRVTFARWTRTPTTAPPTSVPEPATGVMLLTGLAALLVRRRRVLR